MKSQIHAHARKFLSYDFGKSTYDGNKHLRTNLRGHSLPGSNQEDNILGLFYREH
jgi:hypothetical protein